MDEYIKREDALKIIDNYSKTVTADGKVVVDAIRDIVGIITPTADVVPKSEYEAVVSAVDNSTQEFLKLHDAYQNTKTEVAREIFEEIGSIIRKYDERPNYHMMLELSLLEKKYTEGNDG